MFAPGQSAVVCRLPSLTTLAELGGIAAGSPSLPRCRRRELAPCRLEICAEPHRAARWTIRRNLLEAQMLTATGPEAARRPFDSCRRRWRAAGQTHLPRQRCRLPIRRRQRAAGNDNMESPSPKWWALDHHLLPAGAFPVHPLRAAAWSAPVVCHDLVLRLATASRERFSDLSVCFLCDRIQARFLRQR